MDWQVVAPVLHFLTVFLFQVPLHHPINKATSQKWHPLNQFSIFCDSFCIHQFYLLPIAKLPTAWAGRPAASHSLSTHCSFRELTLLLSWGAQSKQTCNSEAPLAAPRPVPCLCKHTLKDSAWKRTCTSTLTLLAALCPISYFELHRLFPSQMALSYPASSHMVWNPSQLCTFPWRQLYCT